MLYNNENYHTILEGEQLLKPVRYFIINEKTNIMHIYGCCQQTKPRSVPIRLFDTSLELENYAGRSLKLCKACAKAVKK